MIFIFYLPLLCYLVGALAGHQMFWHPATIWLRLLMVSLWVGFGIQLIAVVSQSAELGHRVGTVSFHFPLMLLLLLLGSALLLSLLRRSHSLLIFGGPVAMVLMGLAYLHQTPRAYELEVLGKSWLLWHIHLMLLAYAMLIFSGLLALAHVGLSSRLKRHLDALAFDRRWSLESLSAWALRLLVLGFTVLTLGLLVGLDGARRSHETGWASDPKILVALLVWLAYAACGILNFSKLVSTTRFMRLLLLAMLLLLAGIAVSSSVGLHP